MAEKCSVDINVLVYAFAGPRTGIGDTARDVLRSLLPDRMVLLTQVLLELSNVAIHKNKGQATQAKKFLELRHVATVLDTSDDDVLAAVALRQTTSTGIREAMIVHAAANAGCATLYTQDLNHKRIIAGVGDVNPFREDDTE